MASLWDALRQYVSDALPGGSLSPETKPVANQAKYIGGLLDPNSPISKDAQNWHKRTQIGLADQLAGRQTPEAEQAYQTMMQAAGMAPVGITKAIGKSAFAIDPSVKLLPEPKSWYHGSPADVYGSKEGWFKPVAGESGVPAVWGHSDPFAAEGYSRGEIKFTPDANGKYPLDRSWYKDYDGNGGVYSLIDNSKNPFIHDAGGKDWVRVPQGKIMREAQAAGHDSVIFKNIADNYDNSGVTGDVIAWFDPNVISKARGSATTPMMGATALGSLLGLDGLRQYQNQ